jgi:hypothetical protein
MEKTLLQRLEIDMDMELIKLVGLFKKGKAPVFNAFMKEHFKIAKSKPDAFVNHPPVLAISLGGTNLKLMIAGMDNGSMMVEHVKAMHIPSSPVDFYEFFDDILIRDEYVKNYLSNTENTYVGFSFPMAILDGIPYHPTKVPNLNGIIVRDIENLNQDCNFKKKFEIYLKDRGFHPAKLFYQSDGIIAHHGAVALCDTGPDTGTTLIICGTGMATGDEENYIQMGIARMLDYDEKLYPADETEDYQYHYALAGKGLFGLMRRCILIKSKEPDSRLAEQDVSEFFMDAHGSKTTVQIWESSLPGEKPEGEAKEIHDRVSADAYAEMQEIAGKIVERCIGSIANSVIATIVKMGPSLNGKGHLVFFEGSIVANKHILPRVKEKVLHRIGQAGLYGRMGVPQPFAPDMGRTMKPLKAYKGLSESMLSVVDITLIGTASSVMAEMCIR